ncbi:MAG TPA: phytoene/squalene synthase family protein [Polyangiales bacterium]|nr:phytoene/squalene synthase family protein [Polyangiales bacterium]
MTSHIDDATRFCHEILPGVSRTFAVSIRLLPGELGAAVGTAYLLCRIADTVEDAPELAADRKAALLEVLGQCFDDRHAVDRFVDEVAEVTGDAAHVRLVRNANLVFARYFTLPAATRHHVRRWVLEMIGGMRKFVIAYPNGIRIQSLDEYKEYCYYGAGTVGYLLTDLWHEHSSSIGSRQYEVLRARSRAFAEALQTVNILKDVARDAERENSIYIPEQLLRQHGSAHATILSADRTNENHAALGALVQLAWHDLDQAKRYLLSIPRRAFSIRLFCALPLLFAYATLRDLTRTPGAIARRDVVKISRAEVKSITLLSMMGVWSNVLMSALVTRTRLKKVRIPLLAR